MNNLTKKEKMKIKKLAGQLASEKIGEDEAVADLKALLIDRVDENNDFYIDIFNATGLYNKWIVINEKLKEAHNKKMSNTPLDEKNNAILIALMAFNGFL